ncbi:PREDICTED: venom protease [Nicrophorus vespilloides]|uniref:Venom protease n=1 Tax=Nicrophorus vespilloides TaxID=110193 RepID=A0ABM1MCS4_NICVS|nr:PREDICTED: venom protease [Nicrophorus vespilloides]
MFGALVLLTVVTLTVGQLAGEGCFHETHQKPGVCKLIGACPSAIKDLQKMIRPQICSFEITAPIICCAEDVATPDIVQPGVGTKSSQKCSEYAKLVNVTYQRPTLSFGPSKNITRNECGFKAVKLVVGGSKAEPKEFPHMAAIGFDVGSGERGYHCGGSLISERFVLTAAHCINTNNFGEAKYVRVGDLNLKDDNENADPQEYNVVQRIRHPQYKRPSRYNDIALLKLERDVIFTPYVRPICLNTLSVLDNKEAIATGWGLVELYGTNNDHLLKVTLSMFSNNLCREKYPPNRSNYKDGILDDSQVCAGSFTERKDTCQGDSGGPLQIYNLNEYCMYTLIGVTSFGKACGIAQVPGVYTRVSHYLEWIENTVWP